MQAHYIGLSLVVSTMLSVSAAGQSIFWFRNLYSTYGIDAPVFDAQGVPLYGTNYVVELWAATAPSALEPVRSFNGLGTRVLAPFTSPGYFISTTVMANAPSFGWAWLQVRAWDVRLGATYEEVLARAQGGYGESPLFFAQGGDAGDQFPTPALLVGLQSFSLRSEVPEPMTGWLLLLGGAPMLLMMRHQTCRAQPRSHDRDYVTARQPVRKANMN